MNGLETVTDEQFERHALEVLGVDGLARFLRLHRFGSGDYTKDRMQWQKDLTVEQIVESIKRYRDRGPVGNLVRRFKRREFIP